ncbi:integrase, catalytic region, zinc finger, CCHC-type containing protein [Tanacetum coccineum]
MSTSKTYQQSLADAGSETRPPMLERGSYIPWASRFRRYINQKRENQKWLNKALDEGDALLHYDVEMELMNLILLSIPNEIYNSVDACTSAKDMCKRVEPLVSVYNRSAQLMNDLERNGRHFPIQFEKLVNVSRAKKLEKSHDPLALDDVHSNSEDPLASAMLLLAQAITQNFSTPTNNRLCTSSNTRNQAIIQGSNAPNETKNVQRTLRTSSSGNTSTVQCYNCSGKGHYARNCPKPRVRDSKYFMEQMLMAKQDEAGVILTDKQNDFLFADASRMEEIEELSTNICLMAIIQLANNTSDVRPSYDSAFISEVQSSSNTENKEQMYPNHTKIINSTIGDDQFDSDIIFASPNGNVNSDSIEKDTHVPDLCALEQLARNAYREAEKQQIFAQKVQKQNTTLTSQLELYKERADKRAKHFSQQAQSQFVRDRDIIRDLEKQQDKLDLDVKDYKWQNEELQKTHSILKRQMSENEDRYQDTVLDLEAKLKKNVDLILKFGNSLQGMFMLGPKLLFVYNQQLKHGLGYPNPYTLKQPISQCPKLYLASSLGNSEISLNVRDTEDTLDDASKSQQKVYEKMNDPIAVANKQNCWTIDYAQINALYKDFVPQKELSAEQKYFPSSFIPSDKNSNATPSIPASMPSESPLIIELDKIKNCFQRLSELIQKNCKRASIFYTSPEEIQLNDFCQDQLKPIVNELQFYFEFFKTLFQRDIKEMKDVFESTESELCELEKQNDFLKDQLLEVSLKHEVELSVLLNHECVDNSLHAEIEQLKKKSIEIQEGLQARIKILEKDVQRCEKQSVDFELKLQHEKEKHKWDSSFKNKNTNPLDYSWISKMEKLEDENVSLDFTVQSLIKERDNVKLEYQKLFNSIKKTRSQTQTEMDELIAHVSEKTYAYGAIRAENQNLLFTISELKTRLTNVEKGMNAASSVRRPMNRDSHVKNRVLANSKKPTKKVVVYIRKNKQTDITSKNVISNKDNVIDVDVANASKAKILLCVSCMQNVLILCHDNCFANYKLNVHSNIRRTLSTKSRTPKSYDNTYVVHKTRFSKASTLSKSLDTTYVVSKPKIVVKSTSKANDKVVQIVLWIVDSGCSKHMTGDRSLLKNCIEKFMGTVRFRNDNFVEITGYGDYIQGNITIYHVYYVEGLGHNLFSVGQFCDVNLEVAFRSKTCYVRNLEGDDLLIGGRKSNLYTITISDMAASSPVCLMSKATSTKSWLWHYRLSHLNFGTINDLTRLDLVDGLPKRTKNIMETINVKFDELTFMASEHDCLEPEFQRFINHNSSAETMNTPSKEDLDNLFGPMFEEYFKTKSSDTPINFAAQLTQIHEDSSSTSSIIVDEHKAPPIVTTFDDQTSPISLTEADEFNQEDSAHLDGNSHFVSYNPPSHEEIESSTTTLELSNV